MSEREPPSSRTSASTNYAHQAEKLSLESTDRSSGDSNGGQAVDAKFITPLDPVIRTADGNRLPAVPVPEAHQINILKQRAEGNSLERLSEKLDGTAGKINNASPEIKDGADSRLESAIPPSRTHPLFPPLPLCGPPSLLRDLKCSIFRITSSIFSTAFLVAIVLGSLCTAIPGLLGILWQYATLRNPDARRPLYHEEQRRRARRKEDAKLWAKKQWQIRKSQSQKNANSSTAEYEPSEGGPDKLICDIRYYARRVGLDAEEFKVQTEDGFIVTLWHVYNPREYEPVPQSERSSAGPDVFTNRVQNLHNSVRNQYTDGDRRYPILLMHGLLQSAGAYCVNDDDSLAFFLCKSGYDVWLGNNRCGFQPEHSLLKYKDPRMWAWNIRQMGVMDLPALISRVLEETGFEKLGLVCHSQGTTEAFVALAKEQRPDLGEKISVFCALAPAVYAGPLIGKIYFKFMRIISPGMFRIIFGIHSFIPLMMTMRQILPGRIYGVLGYRVFSFLFNWSDDRWDRELRDRMFQFSPVYVSAESMRWWLGRECFATHKCVLATKEEARMEDTEEDEEDEDKQRDSPREENTGTGGGDGGKINHRGRNKSWYNEQIPPMALWVAGSDELVDGRRLIRRFEQQRCVAREPFVRIVHSKVIEEYQHLDVLWAMDAIDQVGKEVRQVLFNTMSDDARLICRAIQGVNNDEF